MYARDPPTSIGVMLQMQIVLMLILLFVSAVFSSVRYKWQ